MEAVFEHLKSLTSEEVSDPVASEFRKFETGKQLKLAIHNESTAQQLSFEWSHTSVSSTDLKVRTTLHRIINNTTCLSTAQ